LAKRIKVNKPDDERSFIERVEELFGDNIVETEDDHVDFIPTGSPSLDVSIGVGGIPRGRFTEIYGPYSSCKTSLCLSIAKSATESDQKVLYVDIEQGLDHDYIERIVGEYDPSKFVLAQPQTGEQALAICEMGVKSGEFAVIILDSVAALAPQKEVEGEASDSNYALIARMMSKFLRRLAFEVRTKNVAFIFINQQRAKIGAYVLTYEPPGGEALKHYSSLMIALSRSEQIKSGEEILGLYSKYVVKKNKVGIPFRTFSFPFMFGKGIDKERDLLELAELLNVVGKRGAFYSFEGVNIGQGIANSANYLREHPDIYIKIKEMCLDMGSSKPVVPTMEDE
jgi:recombination protein RecA